MQAEKHRLIGGNATVQLLGVSSKPGRFNVMTCSVSRSENYQSNRAMRERYFPIGNIFKTRA
jgi:hypothetical protein